MNFDAHEFKLTVLHSDSSANGVSLRIYDVSGDCSGDQIADLRHLAITPKPVVT